MIVMKFGGTSVESAEAMERVAAIVRVRLDRHPLVIVSAMGKTTNKLLSIASAAVEGKRQCALEMLDQLKAFHRRESAGLDVEAEIDSHFEELAELVKGLAVMGELTPRSTDAISSYGERISSILLTARFRRCGIDAVHLDARQVIVTDRRHTHAAPLFYETNARLEAIMPASGLWTRGGHGRLHWSVAGWNHDHARARRIGLYGGDRRRRRARGRDPDLDGCRRYADLRSGHSAEVASALRRARLQKPLSWLTSARRCCIRRP